MNDFEWSRLNHLQRGRYAEYFLKMEFTLKGLSVFSAEVDDRGIDVVVRTDDARHFDVQIKSAYTTNYIFFRKDLFRLRENLLAGIALFEDGAPPKTYLIPSMAWREPDLLLCAYDYKDKKSAPEWGLRLSRKSRRLLDRFAFDEVIARVIAP